MIEARAMFPADPVSVSDARHFVRRTLDGWGAGSWEYGASQVVSELATNSVIHAKTAFEVELCLDDRVLRLAVSDRSSAAPLAKPHSTGATTGRGLGLVAAFSLAWGVERRLGGKAVWCTLLGEADHVTVTLDPSDVKALGCGGTSAEQELEPSPGADTPDLRLANLRRAA